MDREDMGMLESGGDANFTLKAFRPEHRCQVRVEDLERNLAVMLDIVCQVHGGHATPAQLALEQVPISQGLLELVGEFCQGCYVDG